MGQFELTPEQTVLCQQMASLARLGGFIIDLAGRRCLWCADEVARIHGLPVDECAALLVADARLERWVHEDDRTRYRRLRARAIEERDAYTLEYRMRNAAGEVLWLYETGEHHRDPDTGAERLIGTIREVTRQRRAEEALQKANEALERRVAERTAELQAAKEAAEAAGREARASHERFLAAAESLRDGLAIYDAEDRLVYHNVRYPEHAPPAFRAVMRLGARFRDMVEAASAGGGMYHTEMGADFAARRFAQRRAPAADQEFRIADGRWVRVRENALPGGGRVLLTSDITERKTARDRLEEREQRWRAIAEGVPLPLVIARIHEPEILFANQLAVETFGVTVGHQPDLIRNAYVRPDDRRTLIERLERDGRVDGFEVQMRRADGRTMWALLSARAMSFDDQPAMLAAVTDISERKAAQVELEERERLLGTVADGIPLPLVITRISRPEVLFVNERAVETFGLRIGAPPEAVHDMFTRPGDRRTLVADLLDRGRVDGFEARMRRIDGTTMWALLSARAVSITGQLAMLLTVTDISERKAAQVELEEREERFRAIAEGVPLSIMIARLEPPEILFANARAEETFGLRVGLGVAAVRAIYVRPAERDRLIEQLEREGRVDNFEVELRRRDGTTIWVLLSARLVTFGGQPAILTATTDITGRKAIEEALRASEARLAAFMENAPVGMYLKDLDGRYVLANPEMSKVFARPAPDMLGLTAADTGAAHDLERIAQSDRAVLATGQAQVAEEYASDLEAYAWSMVIRFPIRDGEGRITHIGGFHVDITRQKEIEQQLKASEQRFRAFAEAHPVPLFIADLDTGRVIFASPPCEDMLKIPLPQLLAGTTAQIYADPDERPKLIAQVRSEGGLNGLEVRLRRANGSTFWGAFTSKLIVFEGKDAVVTAIVDLTERKRVEAELERQRQILHQNEKMSALGSLLAGVAHELNNPLSVVVGHAGLLEELSPDESIRARALKIRTAADRCARIVRTFLAMARSKPRQRGPVHLNATIDAALEIVAYGLRTAGIEVVRNFDPDLPPVWGDGDQLHQVFANLLVNAQQALQLVPGSRRLTVTTGHDATSVCVEVADNGTGIPAEIAHRVFEPFFTTKPQGVGTGVGLSVCHGIVSAHDGEITIRTAPGGGAAFVVRLPRSAEPAAAVAPVERPPAWCRGRILVVDDEADIAQLLTDVLERDGHQVDRALSGRDALARLAGRPVDLIISDLRMPDMDGAALYREIATQAPELAERMVFVTGDTLAADMTGFLSEIGARVIEKPLDPGAISDIVQRLLAERAQSGRRAAR